MSTSRPQEEPVATNKRSLTDISHVFFTIYIS